MKALIGLVFSAVFGAAAIAMTPHALAETYTITVSKNAGCGCCNGWIDHLKAAGHRVTASNVASGALARLKLKLGIGPKLASCHTAQVSGYVIEGHVPVADIERLLKEKPEGVVGLAVPGMPLGSPGMEAGRQRDAYDVLAVRRDGTTEVFASYPAVK